MLYRMLYRRGLIRAPPWTADTLEEARASTRLRFEPRANQSMHTTRRAFLQSVAITAAALSTSCTEEPAPKAPLARIALTRRTVHVNLAHAPQLASSDRLRLVVAGKAYPLTQHTEATRKQLLQSHHVATHFVRDVQFSAIGAQSYVVGVPSNRGVMTPLASGIHIPTRAHASANGEEDPYELADATTVAIYCVFHNPLVVSLDADTAARVVDHIQQTSAFTALVEEIENVGRAVTPEQAAEGRAGWLTAVYSLDKNGQRIQRLDVYGKPMFAEDKTPLWAFSWEPYPDVANATQLAVTETLERLHSDATLEGVKYITSQGTGQAVQPTRYAGAPGDEEEFEFLFPDQDRQRYRRAFSVEKKTGSSFALTVKNPNSLGTIAGAAFFDEDGNQITSKILGYVQGTFYPSLSAIFGPSTGEFTVSMPTKTATVHLYSAAIAANRADFGETLNPKSTPASDADKWEGVDALLADFILSGILDFMVPGIMLQLGLGGETAKVLNEHLFKEILKEVGIEALVDVAKAVVVDIFNAAEGQFIPSMLLDLLKDIPKVLVAGIAKFIAKGMAATIAAILAEVTAEAAAASAAEAAVPIAGWVLKAVELGQTAAQLIIQTSHIIDGGLVIRSVVQPAHAVKLVVGPRTEQSQYFPPSAVRFEANLTLPSRLPIAFDGPFDPTKQAVTLLCPHPVPLYGALSVSVKLFNATGEVVGEGTTTVPNATELGKEQEVELEVEGRAVAIRPTTRLRHLRKLVPTATTRSYVETSVGPVADESALSCSDAAKVCELLGLTIGQVVGQIGYAFRTQMACKQGLAAQMHLAPVAGAVNVKRLACGVSGTLAVVFAKGEGQATVLANGEAGQTLAVYPFDPRGPLPTEFDPKLALGVLRGTTLRRAKHHPAGYVLALTEVGVEVVDLNKSTRLGAPASPMFFARRGARLGQFSGPISLAPLPDALGYVLLEQGTMRLQALDFSGGTLATWATSSQLPLALSAGKTLLDVEVDSARNVWVLSTIPNGSKPAFYRLEVFNKLGAPVVMFTGVNAHAMAVDAFGTVFTENAENVIGPDGYAEPTISLWAPENR
jgi:hypothetical protein